MKERLDKYLTDLGYFETKSKASAAILAGNVKIGDKYITKAGFQIDIAKDYAITVKSMPYVSRGGFKLKKRWMLSNFPPTAEYVLMRELRQAGLQTVFCKTGQNLFMPLMWVTDSSTGKFVPIRG